MEHSHPSSLHKIWNINSKLRRNAATAIATESTSQAKSVKEPARTEHKAAEIFEMLEVPCPLPKRYVQHLNAALTHVLLIRHVKVQYWEQCLYKSRSVNGWQFSQKYCLPLGTRGSSVSCFPCHSFRHLRWAMHASRVMRRAGSTSCESVVCV